MKTHEEFMSEAIRLAKSNVSTLLGGPFGAVVVKNGKFVASGTNMVTSSQDPTAHAEIVAIRNACEVLNVYRLEGCEIYCSCEPCPMCLSAIYWARIEKIYYACSSSDASNSGFDDSCIYKELSLPKNERKIPSMQILREKGIEAFTEWNNNPNVIEY